MNENHQSTEGATETEATREPPSLLETLRECAAVAANFEEGASAFDDAAQATRLRGDIIGHRDRIISLGVPEEDTPPPEPGIESTEVSDIRVIAASDFAHAIHLADEHGPASLRAYLGERFDEWRADTPGAAPANCCEFAIDALRVTARRLRETDTVEAAIARINATIAAIEAATA